MTPSDLPWWVWLLVAAVLWLAQLLVSIFTEFESDNIAISAGIIQAALKIGMVLSGLIGIILFVKWVWSG